MSKVEKRNIDKDMTAYCEHKDTSINKEIKRKRVNENLKNRRTYLTIKFTNNNIL